MTPANAVLSSALTGLTKETCRSTFRLPASVVAGPDSGAASATRVVDAAPGPNEVASGPRQRAPARLPRPGAQALGTRPPCTKPESVITTAPSLPRRPRLPVAASRAAAPRHPGQWRQAVLLPALMSLGLGLWGVRRDGSIWRDEAVTFDMAHRSLPQLSATVAHIDLVHTVHYLFMHGLFKVFGRADPLLVLRLPSVLAMTIATLGVSLVGRRLAGPRAGVLAGALFAVLPQVQRFAQEGRSYAMVTACVVWGTYILVRALRGRSPWAWGGYAALMLAASLLHEFAVLAAVAHVWAVPRAARRRWVLAAALPLAGVAPIAWLSSGQSAQVAWIGLDVSGLAWFFGAGAVSVLCARFLRSAPDAGTHEDRLIRLALPLALLPGALLLLASLVQPLFVDRYVLYTAVGHTLLAGAALDRVLRIRRHRKRVITAALCALLGLLPYSWHLRTPESRRDDTTAIAHAVRELAASGDGVLYEPSRRRSWSFTDPGAFAELRDTALDTAPDMSGELYGKEAPAPVIRSRLLALQRIVALSDPQGETLDPAPGEVAKRQVLARDFEACRTLHPQGARVTLYARPGHC